MKIQKTILLAMVVALLCCGVLPVQAAEISAPPADQISSDLNYASVSKSFPIEIEMGDAQPQMVYIRASISKASSSSVTVTVETVANLKCIDIGASVEIQRWINNAWEPYTYLSLWAHGVSRMEETRTVSVETGYYYRINTTHMCISEKSSKYGSSTTKSVLVN